MKNLENVLEKITSQKFSKHVVIRGGEGIVYTRVSTLEQAQNNGSLEVQLKYCKQFGINNKIPIANYFGGCYESAKTDGRKEFMRMLDYARKNKNISYIIVFNYDRFSRTGAAASKLSEELRKEGIIVKSVTQDIDTSTAIGRLQENFFHMLNNFDNSLKSERTIINTREVMLKGYWPYKLPVGYDNLKPKHRACFHEYVINDAGKELKKGFYMLLEGKYLFLDIIDRLKLKGVEITEKSFRHIFSNPFYAGYITGKLVDGKLIKGKHPALIDLKTFLAVQELLNNNPVAGIPKVSRHNDVPLKAFAKDALSEIPLTGYKTKGIWYYKTKVSPIPLNVKAEKLNNHFEDFLRLYQYNPAFKGKLQKTISERLKKRLSTQKSESAVLKKKISEKQTLLEKLEKKFISDLISEDIYQNHRAKILEEIRLLDLENKSAEISSSNLEKSVFKCLQIAQNLSHTWVSANYLQKQQLQKLIFPEGILYHKQNDSVRTKRVNSLFEAIPILASDLEEKEKGDSPENRLNSNKVPRTGFEPAHPCGRCDLNTVRLPISPSGQINQYCYRL